MIGKDIIYRLIQNNKLFQFLFGWIWGIARGVYLWWHSFRLRRLAKSIIKSARDEKRPIRVAFMLYDLPFWKSEALFKAMLEDEKFAPVFWVTDAPLIQNKDIQLSIRKSCDDYVRKNNFPFYEDVSWNDLKKQFSPDFVFVAHPYDYLIPFSVKDLRDVLVCYIPYGYSNMAEPRVYAGNKIKYFYRYYLESAYIQQEARKYMKNNADNTRVSGLPMADWIKGSTESRETDRKCIIWAPHWTIRNHTGGVLDVSTFLTVADDMLKIARKYESKITMVFKPHPLLKRKLYADVEWGQERTEAYFKAWEEGVNTSMEEGNYADLFARSDAMIHDSGSFIQEYLLTNKPCLYMVRSDGSAMFNKSTKQALDCYQKGYNAVDVDNFVQSVLNGEDPLADKREAFLKSYLLPKGQSPVKNIIQDLLNP